MGTFAEAVPNLGLTAQELDQLVAKGVRLASAADDPSEEFGVFLATFTQSQVNSLAERRAKEGRERGMDHVAQSYWCALEVGFYVGQLMAARAITPDLEADGA